MRLFYLLFVLITLQFIFISGQGQTARIEGDTLLTLRPILRLNIMGPGLGIEAPASEMISVYVEAGASFDQVPTVDLQGMPDQKLLAVPYANLQFRFYYNLHRRQRKGKRVDKQSANFVGISAPYFSASPANDRLAGLGPVWGLQRHFGKYGYTGFLVGPGFYLPSEKGIAMANLQVSLNTWVGVGFAF